MTQWHDPIVEEVRNIREQQAAELHFDLEAIFERARERQEHSPHKTVSFATAPMSANRKLKSEAESAAKPRVATRTRSRKPGLASA